MVEQRIVIPLVVGSSPILHPSFGNVAPMVEQWTENSCVTGSSPVIATKHAPVDKLAKSLSSKGSICSQFEPEQGYQVFNKLDSK